MKVETVLYLNLPLSLARELIFESKKQGREPILNEDAGNNFLLAKDKACIWEYTQRGDGFWRTLKSSHVNLKYFMK